MINNNDFYKLVTVYLGYEPQFPDYIQKIGNNGDVFIETWNITDKPQPTIEQLEALMPQVEELELKTLTITPREFILGLMSYGVTKMQIESLLNSNSQAWAELTFATCVVRGNPLLDLLCGQLGVTPAQLDSLFRNIKL